MPQISQSIAERIKEAKPGAIFFPGDLLELGSPEAIHTKFSRLAGTKQLIRLAKGIYLKPQIDPELGPLKPSLEDLARTVAERDKVVIRPTGAYALNRLGLSTQVPTRVVFLTNGNPKNIKVGKSTLVFQKNNTETTGSETREHLSADPGTDRPGRPGGGSAGNPSIDGCFGLGTTN